MLLARASIVYTVACAYYLLTTRKLGTPFFDSLTPDQVRTYQQSVQTRSRAFYTGAFWGVVAAIAAPLR